MSSPSWWYWHEQIIRLQDVHCLDFVFKWDLLYKAKPYYMTHEGYGTGTVCWYIALEIGSRYTCCADTPAEAVAIGLNTAITYLHRKLDPFNGGKTRVLLLDYEAKSYQKLLEKLEVIDTEWTDKPTQDTYHDRVQQKQDEFYGGLYKPKENSST